MKICVGNVPKDERFYPQKEGWKSIREPNPLLYQILAVPIGILITYIIYLLTKNIFSLYLYFSKPIVNIALILLITIVHECLHAVCHPKFGISDKTILGMWPQKFLFYAHYEEKLIRNRLLLVYLNPFIFLSLIPVLIVLLFELSLFFLIRLAIINALLSCGDILGFFLLIIQVPKNAYIKNKGWKSYWKIKYD
ncbi:DUF3267 domain-containing protein [Natronospora cellulosivora (SeqCode)]